MKSHIHIIFLCLCLMLSSMPTKAQTISPPSPKHEIRAVWLATIGGIDWPYSYQEEKQKEELRQTLDKLKHSGINTVLLQTRVRGTTIYPSHLEPWDKCMTGVPGKAPNYDPLQFAIDECHNRGMQLHAWVVTLPVGKWNKLGCTHLRQEYPQLITKIGEEGYLNPEKEETGDYLAKICQEIVTAYDVDGIHLDYIRYPEKWKLRTPRSEGRANITNIVRKIYTSVKALKPWVMMSCSPIGKYDDLLRYPSNGWNARTTVCQDAQQWMKEGIMDALFPMMYFRDNNFFPFAIDWNEHSYGRIVVPGLGIYFLDPKEGRWILDDVERQLNVIRGLGMGHCHFRSKFFTDNTKGIYDLGCWFNATPALIPPMTWQSDKQPASPSSVSLRNGVLKWEVDNTATSQDLYLLYNIYASKTYPVDITKAENLMVTRWKEKLLHVQEGLYYAVTAQDRYGQESAPCQSVRDTDLSPHTNYPIHPTISSGKILLPKKESTFDANYVVIANLHGRAISAHPYQEDSIYIAHLPEGMYQIRAYDPKGRNHRIGFFSFKRKKKASPNQ